jgi:quercetin dioxygenase-like cupin family protein
MDHARGRVRGASTARAGDTFIGAVLRDPILANDALQVSTIAFEPGAHTYWHSHGDGQLLFIDHGRGVIVTRDGESRSMQAADVIYAPPGEEHWHGAAEDSYLAQTTVSMGRTSWFEEVPSAEYRSACEATKDD